MNYVHAGSVAGVQQPKVESWPEFESSYGEDALELAEAAGLVADPWQANIVIPAMGVRADDKWSAFEVGVGVSRQNGKGSILEIRVLAGLYLVGERLITWSAHQFDTSLEAFRRVLELTEEADLQREIKRVSKSHGEEGIELKSGQRIRFRTRTKGGGRGFSGDLLILDEAMILPESALGAVFPTLSARPNPQVWFTGSAVDRMIHEHGMVFSRVRERGRRGEPRLGWVEFGAPFEHPDEVTVEAARDPRVWATANPSLGIRITEEYVASEQRALAPRTFAVERLGVWDPPDTSEDAGRKIGRDMWRACLESAPRIEPAAIKPVAFAYDIDPEQSHAAIAVAGVRADGKVVGGILQHGPGTDWVAGALIDLGRTHQPRAIVWDEMSEANMLADQLAQAKVRKLKPIKARELVQACGVFFAAVTDRKFVHIGQPELDVAVDAASERFLTDAWAWARRNSSADITPLVAVTLAVWAAVGKARKKVGVVDLAAALAAAEQQETAG